MNIADRQRALYRLGFDPGLIDGVDGPATLAAVTALLAARGLDFGTAVDEQLAHELDALPAWMPSPNFNVGPAKHRAIRLIVIHTAETPELHDEARNVGGWFALKQSHVSAHYIVDDDKPVQCVLERDLAWHAGTNFNGFDANQVSIGIEHAGTALQSSAQWDDDYSRATLEQSARLVADLCKRFNVPIVRPSADELRSGTAGIVGHVDVNAAWSNGRGHIDPGIAFPWTTYLARVLEIAQGPEH
jgi:N-acetyl-anhydromuramyl-L-alanine amidase AmpD